MLKYKGYVGVVHFDDEAMIFPGDVVGLCDVITFRGTTPEELKKEFITSVDGYLDWCKELGQKPEKPFSGNIHLRLNLHFSQVERTDEQSVFVRLPKNDEVNMFNILKKRFLR